MWLDTTDMKTRVIYRIHGMDCAEEIEALKATVGKLPQVSSLEFNLLNASMSLNLDDGSSNLDILNAVQRAGLRAEPLDRIRQGQEMDRGFWERRGRLITCVASGAAMSLGLLISGGNSPVPSLLASHQNPADSPVIAAMALFLASVILGMWHTVTKAAVAAANRRADMNLLMTLAILGAMAIGDWVEASGAASLFALALWLESWSIGRSRRAIGALTRLSPSSAHCLSLPQGTVEDRPAENVAVGATILVYPGERFPLDARVEKGHGTVNESALTGESVPVMKNIGNDVFAGTVNNESLLTLIVTRPAADSVLSRIIRMVEEAENSRAPLEQWIDRFARRYTPIMLLLAISIAVLPPLILNADWSPWIERALVLLVIACPCALVIATPVGIIAGITAAAHHGVLIKGGVHLETASRLKALAIDKTGTLTCGQPSVQDVIAFQGLSANDVLMLAASLEQLETHPFSRAITRKAVSLNISPLPLESFNNIPGKGAEGVVNGQPLWIGSHRLVHEKNAETAEGHTLAKRIEDDGRSVVALGRGSRLLGLISISDSVRPSAAPMVASLRRLGIQHMVMLTGDNKGTAAAVARITGMDSFHAELLPEGKMILVHNLTAEYRFVGMIGDGINDAPAMASATLGIAMAASGSDTAIESADISLMTDDLSRIPWMIHHAQRVMNTIRANAFFAITIKLAIMLLSIGGMASLWMAIAADTGTTLIVVLWSLRLIKG